MKRKDIVRMSAEKSVQNVAKGISKKLNLLFMSVSVVSVDTKDKS